MKTAVISESASGDNEVVAAVAGRRIRVCGYVLSFGGTVNAKWRSATTDLTGLLYGVLGTAVEAPVGPQQPGGVPGWFETAVGEALNLNLSGATAVGGHVSYLLVD
jgi:hypothetical protein